MGFTFVGGEGSLLNSVGWNVWFCLRKTEVAFKIIDIKNKVFSNVKKKKSN